MGYRGRDVEVTFRDGLCLVAACDSCGAVGEKELDAVQVPAYVTGRFTARVALFEVLATGAEPQIVTAAICNEPDPTGEKILKGVRDELNLSAPGPLPMAISCEKNMPTKQTGLGISVVGLGEAEHLRIALTRPGDDVYCLGIPKVGPEVHSPDDPDIVQAGHIRRLLALPAVHDIIPVGSQGILGEIHTLETALRLRFVAANEQVHPASGGVRPLGTPDLHKSGGPSTCVVFSAEPGVLEDLKLKESRHGPVPMFRLGTFQA